MDDYYYLDSILGKMGFAGLKDCLATLKSAIVNLKPDYADVIRDETDLHVLILTLHRCTEEYKK